MADDGTQVAPSLDPSASVPPGLTYPMLFPDGSRAMVTQENIAGAAKDGGKLAQPMSFPDGTRSYVAYDNVPNAVRDGGKFMASQAQAYQQMQQVLTPSSAKLPRLGQASPAPGFQIGAPPPFRGVPGAQPAAVPVTQPAQNVLAQQGLAPTPTQQGLAPAGPPKPEPFELGETQTRPFAPGEQQDLQTIGWKRVGKLYFPEEYHGQFEQEARQQQLEQQNPVGTMTGMGQDIASSEWNKMKAGYEEASAAPGLLAEGDIVHAPLRAAFGGFKMSDPLIAAAYATNPITTVGGLIGGTALSEAGGAAARAAHASPETEQWAQLTGAMAGGFFGGYKASALEMRSGLYQARVGDYMARGATPEAAATFAKADVNKFWASGDGDAIGMPGLRMPPLVNWGRSVGAGVLGGLRAVVPFTGGAAEERAGIRPGPMGEAGYVPPGPPTLPEAQETTPAAPGFIRSIANTLYPRLSGSAADLATEAFRPRNSKSNWRAEVGMALPDMARAAQSMGIDPEEDNVSLAQSRQIAETALPQVWAEYQNRFLDPNKDTSVPVQRVADAIRAVVTPRMREQNPGLVNKIERIASTYELPPAAEGEPAQPRNLTVPELQQRVSELNGETRAIEGRYITDKKAAKADPTQAYKFAERDALRGLLDQAMDAGGPEAAQLRRRYGALNSVLDVISRREVVADRQSKVSLTKSLAMVGAVAQVAHGAMTLNPHWALSGAATLATMLATERYIQHITDPNYLTTLALRRTEPTPAWQPMPEQGRLPFPDFFGVGQTPAPQRTGPFAMPPSPLGPQEQGQLPAGPEQLQLPGTEQRQLAAPQPAPVVPEMPPFRMRPSPLGPQAPALGPARLPERQISPTPGFEAPTAPSASAEQEALQRARAQGRGPTPEINQGIEDLFTGRQKSIAQAHRKAISNMLLDAEAPPESMDWNVVRPGRGLPNAIQLNDTARQMIGASMGTGFGGASVSPATLDTEVLPRLEMAAQAMDNTRAQRPDYFSPEASAKVRDLIQTIEENRGPEGISFTRSEGTPEQQRYTTHEELFHTAVQRRPAAQPGGLHVPDMSDDPGFEAMRQRIYNETGRLTSVVQHAEGMADIMQGRAPELTPEQAGASAEEYWSRLASSGKQGLQALVDAFKLENFMDDHEQQNGYTVDDATNAIRTAGRDALARVLSREYGTNLRGLARAVQGEPAPADVGGAERSAVPAGPISPAGGETNLGSPAETAAGAGPNQAAEIEPPEEAPLFSDRDKRISVRKPTAPSATEDPIKKDLQANMQAIRDSGLAQKVADQVEKYPGVDLSGDADSVLRGFLDHAVSNLLWLHDQFPKAWRDQAKQWYDGANKLSKQWSKDYGVSPEQVAGVIASQSPQKDWHMNVSLAQRILDITQRGDELEYSPEMAKKAPQLAKVARDAAFKKADKAEAKGDLEGAADFRANAGNFGKALRKIAGRDYSDLTTPREKALWIRLYDEAHNSRTYNIYAPDGSVIGPAMTDKGNVAKVAWGSTPMIAKAVSILEDGSRGNISDQLGNMHKIRSFYNNIIAPKSKAGDVTIDTHAVAAANLRPLAGKDTEVKQNFGGGGSSSSAVTGVKGNYGLYGDAYREAAAQRGLLPRELQSITWEAVRSLFTKEFKTKENKGIIDNIWKEHSDDPEQARDAIKEAAGGFTPPSWASGGRDLAGNEGTAPADDSGLVPGAGLRARPAGGTVGGGRSASAGAVPAMGRKIATSPVPQIFKRISRR